MFLVFVGYLFWYFLRIEMLGFLRYMRLGELWIIGLFTDQQFAACYDWLKQAPIRQRCRQPPLRHQTNEGVDLAWQLTVSAT